MAQCSLVHRSQVALLLEAFVFLSRKQESGLHGLAEAARRGCGMG